MQDIGFQKIQNADQSFADLLVQNGDLAADDGLETAVLISLFTDRFVPKAELPENVTDPRGWWADELSEISGDKIGSRFWLLERGKLTVETKNQMKDYAQEALAWMVSEGLAAKLEVVTTLIQGTRIDLAVKIYRPEGDNIPFKFIWDGQALKRTG